MSRPGFANAVALKEDRIQLVTDVQGNIPAGNTDGYGLYMQDTRFLSRFDLLVNDAEPIYLSHSADRNYIATFQFVNPPLVLPDGSRVPRQTISIRRSRFVDGETAWERIGFYNCNQFAVDIQVTLNFDADFLDIFAVRQYFPHRRSGRRSAQFAGKRLTFAYTGRDRVKRKTVVQFDRKPEPASSNAMLFHLHLEPHEPDSLTLRIQPSTDHKRPAAEASFDRALQTLAGAYDSWFQSSTQFETNNEFFDRSLLRQSRLDIRALLEFSETTGEDGETRRIAVPDAGIPWYAVPFGRDSIITALQTLAYNPEIAEGTLRVLARYQGIRVDERTEEEPGKIFHELRAGELANLREIPHLPYYGTIDATPLFVVLFVETMRWLGTSPAGLELYRELLPSVLRALEWVDGYGDLDGDGYVEYRGGPRGLLKNQGWKDSAESLQYPDGSAALTPVALVEVQGYVYQAKMGLSRLARLQGDPGLADRIRDEAAALKATFNRDFWMSGEQFFAQALDGEKRQIPSITSNAGHVLWSGIADPDKAAKVVERLMAEDMFSGWGIRTLSSRSPNFNPMSYHNGSVWPHDNSLIAAGMRRYGFDREAADVVAAVIDAGLRFPANRLPELFCGFPRDRRFNSSPAAYIVSCSPQAWAAASPFLCLQTLLDIQPEDGEALRLNPAENQLFFRYTVRHMRVGNRWVDFDVLNRAGECRITSPNGDVLLRGESARVVA